MSVPLEWTGDGLPLGMHFAARFGAEETLYSLAAQLEEHAGDTERQMDALRHFKHAQTFRLLAQDLAGLRPLETLSDHLSDHPIP